MVYWVTLKTGETGTRTRIFLVYRRSFLFFLPGPPSLFSLVNFSPALYYLNSWKAATKSWKGPLLRSRSDRRRRAGVTPARAAAKETICAMRAVAAQHSPPPPRGEDSHMKGAGILIVALRGVNFRFWSCSVCSGQNTIILSRKGLF